ncbi:hypothetical protein GCM10027073_06930 [Streptomyces chlorus]
MKGQSGKGSNATESLMDGVSSLSWGRNGVYGVIVFPGKVVTSTGAGILTPDTGRVE